MRKLFLVFTMIAAIAIPGCVYAQSNTANEAAYLCTVEETSGGEIIYHLCRDFDGDGTEEMFALVRRDPSESAWEDEEGIMAGRVWYVNGDDAIEVSSVERPYYQEPAPMEFDGGTVLPLHQAFTSGTRTYLWGVLGGKPYELNASGRINGLFRNEYGEIQGIGEAFDSALSKDSALMTGHTFNAYYFFYDQGNIREYGGMAITWADFLRIPGITEAADLIEGEMAQEGAEIDSIVYRANGIVAVNLSAEDSDFINYENIQLRITDQGVEILGESGGDPFAGGTVREAFLEYLAIFPEEFPY